MGTISGFTASRVRRIEEDVTQTKSSIQGLDSRVDILEADTDLLTPEQRAEVLGAAAAAADAKADAQKAAADAQKSASLVGAPPDTVIATAVSGSGTQTVAALKARESTVDLTRWPGVDPNGVTECAAAIQAAIDHARATNRAVIGRGFFKIGSTITLRDSADLSKCVFTYTPSTGIALVVGHVEGVVRRTISTPLVMSGAKTEPGWAQVAGTIGIRLLNVESCYLSITGGSSFDVGLEVYGQGRGTAYNTITLGALGNNRVNLQHDADETGWANQNTFLGGRLAHDGSEGQRAPGTRHILHKPHARFPADGNVYVGVSLESPGVVEAAVESSGTYNQWVACRWEDYGPPGTKKVIWRPGAKGNVISGGYEADKLTVVTDAGAAHNRVVAPMVGEQIWVAATGMGVSHGAPVRESAPGGTPITTLRASTRDGVGTTILVPDGWTRIRVEALWTNQSMAAGSVRLTLTSMSHDDGANLYSDWPANVSTNGPTDAPPASVVTTTVLNGSLPVTAGLRYLSVSRDGASDTLAGNVILLGLKITRAA